jgi:hypothetical protein
VYLRSQSSETQTIFEAWLIDPSSGAEEQLPINNFTQAYKRYGSTKLWYRPIGDAGEYRLLDLATGIEESHALITHPDPNAGESMNIQELNAISPDNKYLVFSVDFFVPCPSPSPLPSGFQGGWGPCQPDESLTTPSGNYIYNVERREATHVGDLYRVTGWDMVKRKLYYITEGATKAMDLDTNLVATTDTTPYFGYITHPLMVSNAIVKLEAATGNGGEAAFGKIYLFNLATQKVTPIDSAPGWAILQPFITASPDERYILYNKGVTVEGIHRNAIYLYDTKTATQSRLTPEDNSVAYRVHGTWTDDKTYITSVDTIEETSYTNNNNYLVKIDIPTGTVTRLTPHDKVYSFNTQ